MKKLDLFILSIMMLLCGVSLAQAPKAFKYQAIIRDNIGEPASNQGLDVRISILENGSIIYTEEHSTTTNQFGLINLEIGRGTVISGVFNNIDWQSNACVIDIEVDLGRTGVYTPIGSNELLSVPYALNGGDNDWIINDVSETIYRTTGNIGIGTAIPAAKVHINNGTLLLDGTVGSTPYGGVGTRMMWIPNKAAFRAGRVVGNQWNDANIGSYSTAVGYNTEASASSTFASGYYSIASSNYAMSVGYYSEASGTAATAIGYQTEASGTYALSLGYSTIASGLASSALGNNVEASGAVSTAIGYFVEAPSYGEVALGFYNASYTPNSTSAYSSTDRVLSVGIGTSSNIRKNAMVILKNGHIGIGTDTPEALVEVEGGSVLFNGTTGNVPVSGAGVRFMWIPEKQAIRAGEVTYGVWDDANVGDHSTAFGYNSEASGNLSTSIGGGCIASGTYAVAMGTYTDATGDFSTALGYEATASGANSFTWGRYSTSEGGTSMALGNFAYSSGSNAMAIGSNTTASAERAIAIGHYANSSGTQSIGIGSSASARSYREIVLGSYNATTTANNSQTAWNALDPILVVGNGISSSNRSNAMVILKSGNMGIGIDAPSEKLHINGKIKFGSYETLEDGGSSRIGTNCAIVPMTDNLFDLGTATNRWDDIYATNGTVQTSDRRNKTNIKPITYGLEDIMKLKPVSFQWKDKLQQGDKLGLIAQEVQTVVKEVVKDTDWEMNESGTLEKVELERLGVYYSDLIPVLIKGMQEQQAQIERLERENKQQQAQIKQLQTSIK